MVPRWVSELFPWPLWAQILTRAYPKQQRPLRFEKKSCNSKNGCPKEQLRSDKLQWSPNSMQIFLTSEISSDFSEKISKNDEIFGQGALRGRLSYSSRLPPVPACPFAPPWPPRKQHCLMEKNMEKYIVYVCLFGDQTGTLCINGTVSAIYQHLDSPDSAECWFLRCLSNGSDVFNPFHPIYGYSSYSLSINITWPSLTYLGKIWKNAEIEKEWCLWQVVTDGRCPL